MLSLPLRGQVWTTIKTEFRWQPSGNSPQHRPQGTGHLQESTAVCTHEDTHTQMHAYTRVHRTSLWACCWGETNKLHGDGAVEFEARGMLEMNYEYNNISLHFRSSCSSPASKTDTTPAIGLSQSVLTTLLAQPKSFPFLSELQGNKGTGKGRERKR